MIKTLLDADENPPPETRVIIEETTVAPSPLEKAALQETAFTPEQLAEAEDILEIPSAARAPSQIADARQANAQNAASPLDKANLQVAAEPRAQSEAAQTKSDAPLFQTAYQPDESTAETARKSGLAYAAALTLFGAVVFMMIVGWGFDLLFGSAPWGIVGGIVLGALIGFVQFFRLSSQIFK